MDRLTPYAKESMKRSSTLCACLVLAACATPPAADRYFPLDEARAGLPYSSPECLAKKLKPVDAFPAASIPAAALSNRQSGWVAIRYDLAAGVPWRVEVVGSSPPGLYDGAALQHVGRYRDSTKTTVAGCVTLIDVKF
jgi:uncharacterized lipoprotein YmbA